MRVDDNKPTSSEQSRSDDKKRQSFKQRGLAAQPHVAQQAGKSSQQREVKSAFDNMLENLISEKLQPQANSESSSFESKLKDNLKEKEKPKEKVESRRDKDSDSKSHKTESSDGNRNVKDLNMRQQVLGKGNSQEQGSSGQQGGGSSKRDGSGGQQSSGQGQRSFTSLAGVAGPALAPQPRTMGVQGFEALQQASHQSPSQIPRQLLDQMIQLIRVGLQKQDQKEILIDLSQKVFRGLSLKVKSQNGKVEVSFLTGDPRIRNLFEGEKNNIAQALQEKGVQVSQVQVQYLTNS